MAHTKPDEFLSPGEYIADELVERGWSADALAQRMGVERTAIDALMTGRRRVTFLMAHLLGEVFETSAEVWKRLQERYDALPQDATEAPK